MDNTREGAGGGALRRPQSASPALVEASSSDHYQSAIYQNAMKLPKEIRNIFAGGIAGMVAKSVVAPFDRIKILYQISSAQFHIWKVPSVAWRIIQEEGLAALWKGNTATMIRVFPYSGIQFMVFDRCKMFLLREQELKYAREKAINPKAKKPQWGLSAKESLGAGMVAGVISVFCTYPLDLTRAQLAVLRKHKDRKSNASFAKVIGDNYRSRVSFSQQRRRTPTTLFCSSLFRVLSLILFCFLSCRGLSVSSGVSRRQYWGFCPIRGLRSPSTNRGNEK